MKERVAPPFEVKLDILNKYYEAMSNSDIPITQICKSLDVYIATLKNWVKKDETLLEIYAESAINRAYIYKDLCCKIAEDMEDFWESKEWLANGMEVTRKREKMSANKAKFRIERYTDYAARLCPDDFSDQAKEIRQVVRDMEEIKKKLKDK